MLPASGMGLSHVMQCSGHVVGCSQDGHDVLAVWCAMCHGVLWYGAWVLNDCLLSHSSAVLPTAGSRCWQGCWARRCLASSCFKATP